MARLASGSRVGKGTVRSANPRIGRVSGGSGLRGTSAHMKGFTQGVAGKNLRITGKHAPMSGSVARGHIAGSRVRSNAIGSGKMIGRGAASMARIDIGTLGGAAAFAAGGYGAAQMVERHHAKKALTAKQLQQRRMAARAPRRTAGLQSGQRV